MMRPILSQVHLNMRRFPLKECESSVTRRMSQFKPQRGSGDRGESSLFTNERRLKSDHIFHALGNNDELTSWLGYARSAAIKDGHFKPAADLYECQCSLQDLNSCIATPQTSAKKHHLEKVSFGADFVEDVNACVDYYASETPPLKQFILPGGDELSGRLHICRSVCRRAERSVAILFESDESLQSCLRYLNRLSDLLFVMARYVTHKNGIKEIVYSKFKKSE